MLQDGSEQVLTDSADTEMFDQSEEDSDVDNQVKQTTPGTTDSESARGEREGTPGPQASSEKTEGHLGASHGSDTTIKGVADTTSGKAT